MKLKSFFTLCVTFVVFVNLTGKFYVQFVILRTGYRLLRTAYCPFAYCVLSLCVLSLCVLRTVPLRTAYCPSAYCPFAYCPFAYCVLSLCVLRTVPLRTAIEHKLLSNIKMFASFPEFLHKTKLFLMHHSTWLEIIFLSMGLKIGLPLFSCTLHLV